MGLLGGMSGWGGGGLMGGGNGWSPAQGLQGVYQNGNILANPGQMSGATFPDVGGYGQPGQNPFAAFGMSGHGQQMPAPQGPMGGQAGNNMLPGSYQMPQSQMPNMMSAPVTGASPFSALGPGYGVQAQQPNPFASFGQFGW